MTVVDPEAIAAGLAAVLERAWNAGDGAAFGEPFASHTDFVDIRGEHHAGDPSVVGHGHQAIFDTIYKGSRIGYRVVAARPVGPDVVIAVLSATLDSPAGPLAGVHSSTITAVIVHEGGTWRITAFHNTLVQP